MASTSRGCQALVSTSKCIRSLSISRLACQNIRQYSQSSPQGADQPTYKSWKEKVSSDYDFRYAADIKEERHLWKTQRKSPIGSRRLRQARATNAGIPFEQLPYQCFQEARKVLAEHREKIITKINLTNQRIEQLSAKPTSTKAEEVSKGSSLQRMIIDLEKLKIEADIHDPQVKRRFENGLGDMNKPIYRHLADQKWREYNRKLIVQRITQMNVVPDVLDHIEPTASVDISFPGIKFQPGEFVESLRSQFPPTLNVQVFDAGPRLVTVVIVDSDVPDFSNDKFVHRCHGIYTNIEISPTSGRISLSELENKNDQVAMPYSPPFAYKGSPYHRLSVWVLEQKDNRPLNTAELSQWVRRDNFIMRKFVQTTRAKPVGISMFRTQWDDGMIELMKKYNIEGTEIQMRRAPPEKAPYKKRDTRRMRG